MEIQAALQAAVDARGWSPTKLAAEAGVTEETSRKWLSGDAQPNAIRLIVLCQLMPEFAENILAGKPTAA